MRFDLWKLELRVIWIHGHQLISCWRSQHLDNLDELVDTALARENGLSQHELCRDASGRPNVNDRRVVCCAEDEFGCPVVPRADIGHVRLPLYQTLRRAEVTELQGVRSAVDQQVLRLDVTVADADGVDVGASAAHLVGIKLHENVRHRLFHLVVMLHHPVDSVGAILHNHVQICLPRLFTRSVEGMFQLNDIRVPQLLHDLELSVFVALVLVDLFDRHRLAGLDDLRLVDDAEGPAAQHALRVVRERRLLRAVS
mmetsp:Transcript_142131/g.354177  ORF Transcript_142131/g.354177 Transcript_142131/m.354177 type:complete len:255 (-) Transcript_142131:206-970(-)